MAAWVSARPPLRKLAANTAIGFAGNSLQKVLTFATTLVLARGLGDAGFGLYSYVVAYMFFFGFLADLGMERVITREVARAPHRAGELIGTALLMKVILSLVALLAALTVAFALDLSTETKYCVFFAALGLPLSIELVLRGYFQSRYELKYTFLVTVPATLAFLGVAIICVYFSLPVRAIFLGGLPIGIVALTILLRIARRHLRLSFRPRVREMATLLRDSASVGLFILLFMMSMRLDQVMLFHLRDAGEVGLYAAAVRAAEALILVPDALLLTVFPLLVSTYQSDAERFRHIYRLSYRYLAAVILPIALVATLARQEVVGFVFGPGYSGAANALAILAWNFVIGYVGAVYINVFIARAWYQLLLIVSGIAVLANIICNLLWIPSYGASGAAAATAVANLIGFLCWCVVPQTRPYMVACLEETWKPALATIAAGLLWFLDLDLFVMVGAMVATYASLLWVLGGLARADLTLLQSLFGEERPPRRDAGERGE